MEVIGHRGCRGLFPENTLVAFKEAINLGVRSIEFDVVVSGDNQIVVSHEPFMSRVTCLKPNGEELSLAEDQQYNLFQMSYDNIKRFDCGLKQNLKFPNQKAIASYKPLLTETIRFCEAYKPLAITYVIEIKSDSEHYGKFYPQPEQYVSLVLKTLNEFNLRSRVILKSFDVTILNEIYKQVPEQQMSLLINRDETIEQKLKLLTFTPQILGPYFKLLNEYEVKVYKDRGFLIYPWTVNKITNIEKVLALDVDGIITDYPDRVFSLLIQ